MPKLLDDFTINALYSEEDLKKNPDLLRPIAQTGRLVKHNNGYKGNEEI